jgi:hypothetical protein
LPRSQSFKQDPFPHSRRSSYKPDETNNSNAPKHNSSYPIPPFPPERPPNWKPERPSLRPIELPPQTQPIQKDYSFNANIHPNTAHNLSSNIAHQHHRSSIIQPDHRHHGGPQTRASRTSNQSQSQGYHGNNNNPNPQLERPNDPRMFV